MCHNFHRCKDRDNIVFQFQLYQQYFLQINNLQEFHFFKVRDNKTNVKTPSREESLQHRGVRQKRKSKVITQTSKDDVTIQWDNGKTSGYHLSSLCLRLFDNGPSGTNIIFKQLTLCTMYYFSCFIQECFVSQKRQIYVIVSNYLENVKHCLKKL